MIGRSQIFGSSGCSNSLDVDLSWEQGTVKRLCVH